MKHNTSTYTSLLYCLDATGMRWGRLSGVHLHFAKNVTFKALNSQKKSKVTQSAIIKPTQSYWTPAQQGMSQTEVVHNDITV